MKFMPDSEKRALYRRLFDDLDILAKKHNLEWDWHLQFPLRYVYFYREEKTGWFFKKTETLVNAKLEEGQCEVYDGRYLSLGKELDQLLFEFREKKQRIYAKYKDN